NVGGIPPWRVPGIPTLGGVKRRDRLERVARQFEKVSLLGADQEPGRCRRQAGRGQPFDFAVLLPSALRLPPERSTVDDGPASRTVLGDRGDGHAGEGRRGGPPVSRALPQSFRRADTNSGVHGSHDTRARSRKRADARACYTPTP